MATVIDLDTASPQLKALLARAKNPTAVHKVMATAATQAVRDRFAEMAGIQRNPWGKPPQFWKRMSRATRAEANPTTAAVVMPREVAQRYFGGVIRPTGGRKFLTIPAHASAYRRSARSFADLVLMVFKGGEGQGGGLALAKRGAKEPVVLYWLRRQVKQKGDSRVIPSPKELAAAVIPQVEAYLLRSRPVKP